MNLFRLLEIEKSYGFGNEFNKYLDFCIIIRSLKKKSFLAWSSQLGIDIK